MNYESIILELMSRVQSLEQKVKTLEEKNEEYHTILENVNDEDEQDEENKITRSVARQFAMDKIEKQYNYLDVQKGNRATRADIIMTLNKGEKKGSKLNAKFYYSKSYLEFPGGWHTVKLADLENDNIDLHIFTLAHEGNYHSWLFSQQDLRRFVQSKKIDSSAQYYFYFHIENGKITESRDTEKDVSLNYEDWDLIGKLIK